MESCFDEDMTLDWERAKADSKDPIVNRVLGGVVKGTKAGLNGSMKVAEVSLEPLRKIASFFYGSQDSDWDGEGIGGFGGRPNRDEGGEKDVDIEIIEVSSATSGEKKEDRTVRRT